MLQFLEDSNRAFAGSGGGSIKTASPMTPPLKNALLSIAIAVSIFVACYMGLGIPSFESIDDPWMAAVASGVGLVDRPDEHIYWTHFLIGMGLKWLYTHAPSVPWYGMYLLSFQVLAISTIIFLFLTKYKDCRTATKIGVVVVLLFAVFARPIMLMKYTTTATLLASVASLILLSSLAGDRNSLDWKRLARYWSVSFVFLLLAALVRERAAYLIITLTAVALCAKFLPLSQWRKLFFGLVWVVTAAAIAIGVSKSNDWYYSRDAWKEFYPLNRQYIPLQQYNRFINNKAAKRAYKSVGWSRSDVAIFKKWYICDPRKFSMENFKRVRREMDLLPEVKLEKIVNNLRSVASDSQSIASILAIFLLFFVSLRRKQLLSNVLLLSGVSGVTLWLLIFLKMTPYVFAATLGFCVLTLLWNSPVSSLERVGCFINDKPKRLAAIVALLLLLTPLVLDYRHQSMLRDLGRENYAASLNRINSNPRDLYIDWGGSLDIKKFRPFDDFRCFFKNLKVVRVVDYGRSPHVMERLRQWGIEDLLRELDRDGLYLAIAENGFEKPIRAYIADTYGKKAVFDTIYDFKINNLRICKVTFTELPEPKRHTAYSAVSK